jgi:hypothetical protein
MTVARRPAARGWRSGAARIHRRLGQRAARAVTMGETRL